MKAFQRAMIALSAGFIIAGIVRLRGVGGTPPQRGGWRELPVDEIV